VIAKLEQAGVERFVLACRAEDWQAATARSIITETFGDPPLELRLKPLNDIQIRQFLASQLGSERAADVAATYRFRGFSDWLENPQTLIMLAAVAKAGELPQNTSALFQTYVELSLREANPVRRQQQGETPREAALDTLGAAFAALILSGKSALAKPAADFFEEDLRLSDLESLPGYVDWAVISGNRLVKTYASDSARLTYAHRRIGEWLGARWVAKYANSVAVRDRLLATLTVSGIVPASLRGLFAWLFCPAFRARLNPATRLHPSVTPSCARADPDAASSSECSSASPQPAHHPEYTQSPAPASGALAELTGSRRPCRRWRGSW
jgi:hypothetical protein